MAAQSIDYGHRLFGIGIVDIVYGMGTKKSFELRRIPVKDGELFNIKFNRLNLFDRR